MKEISSKLDDILHNEEVALWQQSRDRKIKDGDNNNAYSHALANFRDRKNHLSELNGGSGPFYTTEEMLEVATSFYKNLFGYDNKYNIHLGPSF